MALNQLLPYNRAFAITKSDTVNIPQGLTDAVYVGGAGIVVAVFQDDSTAQFTCVAGQILPVKVKRVNSTTTTATLMVALYTV
jgi:hypothetical protein